MKGKGPDWFSLFLWDGGEEFHLMTYHFDNEFTYQNLFRISIDVEAKVILNKFNGEDDSENSKHGEVYNYLWNVI